MIKTLFLVHIEETFRNRFTDGFIRSVIKEAKKCDDVIHFTSNINDYAPVFELRKYVTDTIDWGWGYEPECFDEDEQQYIISSSGHEWTWIPPELRNFDWKKREIILGGGCDGSCLADMESILSELNVDFNKMYSLVYS